MSDHKKRLHEALDEIDSDLGSRSGKESLTSMRTKGEEATKGAQNPSGSGGSEGHFDRKDKEPHHSSDTAEVLKTVGHYEGKLAGGASGKSEHFEDNGKGGASPSHGEEHDGGEGGEGSSAPHAAIKSYLAKGYTPQEHEAHLLEHYDHPVSHMIGKKIK